MRAYILTLAVVVVLISCRKDDPKPSIVGHWIIESATPDIKINGQSMKEFLIAFGMTEDEAQKKIDSLSAGSPNLGGSFAFKSDGVWNASTSDGTDSENVTGTWKLSDDGRTLTMTDNAAKPGEQPTTATVDSLTDSELQVSVKLDADELTGDDGDGGIDFGFPLEFSLIIKLKRG